MRTPNPQRPAVFVFEWPICSLTLGVFGQNFRRLRRALTNPVESHPICGKYSQLFTNSNTQCRESSCIWGAHIPLNALTLPRCLRLVGSIKGHRSTPTHAPLPTCMHRHGRMAAFGRARAGRARNSLFVAVVTFHMGLLFKCSLTCAYPQSAEAGCICI